VEREEGETQGIGDPLISFEANKDKANNMKESKKDSEASDPG
jgi:hypothetical protein